MSFGSTFNVLTNNQYIMKVFYLFVIAAIVFTLVTTEASAQLNFTKGSQKAIVGQTIGITKIEIDYSRPCFNYSEVWGKLVTYGMNNIGFGKVNVSLCQADDNENITIDFNTDISVVGKAVKAISEKNLE